MKFAFLVHPISDYTGELWDLAIAAADLRSAWGNDPFRSCSLLRQAMRHAMEAAGSEAGEIRVVDNITGLVSVNGRPSEGRIYEIPLRAEEFLANPTNAIEQVRTAAEQAVEWGAEIVGLGAMTGIVGAHGTWLAENLPIAVTTGNSLTVYAAYRNLLTACEELDIDLTQETVAVVGIPGSIATGLAGLIKPHCRELLVVSRQSSPRALKRAESLGAELLTDIEEALQRSRIILTATSSGGAVPPAKLRSGSIVLDVAVPPDVEGAGINRTDVLILTAGLSQIPATMPRESGFLWFHRGMIPSCLAETMVLALEDRKESLSLGQNLSLAAIERIGQIAESHKFGFGTLHSFGHPIELSRLTEFRKTLRRRRSQGGGIVKRSTSLLPTRSASLLYQRHINPILGHPELKDVLVKTFVRGEGMHLYDEQGREYLDFVAGFGSVNLGHNPPQVVGAIREALTAQVPGFAQAAVNPLAAKLADELVAVSPQGLDQVFFSNSGSEANEAALKLARAVTGRTAYLSCERSYHGKTLGSLSVTGNVSYRKPFEPLIPDCHRIPFGDFEKLEEQLETGRYAAFIVEPIQAEGGMYEPRHGWLREAESLCRANNTLFIVDEVQTGMGRTGNLFACDHDEVSPDVMTLAKSLGGGMMPIGATLMRREHWNKAYGSLTQFALHTSTFGGGSLACAAGSAAVDALSNEQLLHNVNDRSEELKAGLKELCNRHVCLKEVRGRGLLLGLEFHPLPKQAQRHWAGSDSWMGSLLGTDVEAILSTFSVLYVVQTLLDAHRIYTQSARSNPFVVRIQPPLIITSEQVQRFLSAMGETCEELDRAIRLTDNLMARSVNGRLANA